MYVLCKADNKEIPTEFVSLINCLLCECLCFISVLHDWVKSLCYNKPFIIFPIKVLAFWNFHCLVINLNLFQADLQGSFAHDANDMVSLSFHSYVNELS